MTVFVEARTDPFAQRRQQLAQGLREGGRNEAPVRRPLRGIEIKEDTYAIIRIMDEDGHFLPVIDAAGEIRPTQSGPQMTTSWTNFIIQNVAEQRAEKQQIVETFGEPYIFFFGESPRTVTVQGFLINSADFNWRAEWWENYERYFRGTRLVERAARLFLIYDDIILEGYMMNAAAQDSAQNNNLINFNFTIFVTGYTNISLIGDPNYPKPAGDIDYTQMSAYGEALSAWDGSRNLQAASTVDAVRKMNQHGIVLGAIQLLRDAIRRSLTSGDPSILGFVQKAAAIMAGASAVAGAVSDIGASALGGLGGIPGPTRELPLRSTFRDNVDEFIGLEVPSAKELASPFSMADAWLEMDQKMDDFLTLFSLDISFTGFFDMMGRAGRSQQEIRQRAANSLAYVRQGGSFSRFFRGPGLAVSVVPGITLRTTPFGVIAMPGSLI